MILELAAISLTTKALVAIIGGSVAGGLLVGGTVSYLIVKKIQTCQADVEQEYEMLDKEASFREKQRQRSLDKTIKRVSKTSEETMRDIANNQKRTATAIEDIEQSIGSAEKHHELGRVVIDETKQENELIKQLMAELRSKTEQLLKITDDYEALKTRLAEAVNKLENALTELDLIKKTISQVSGERDYAGQVIEKIKRMKSSNTELKTSLDIQTEKYAKAEQRIVALTACLQKAKTTILEQEKIISGLQNEVTEPVIESGQSSQTNLRFF
ncbi:chromosome segregation protein SMC [Legionella massiliensis]|uniref:Chromosome segregation protein SMC n=1 Tax=Legionella massiliensis TaxID=1034943 RepID=A0A078KWE8_9GAMM|nr:hypothetical protein [Legionella massiliensis]CDZ77321.1 chromosome segregation protein SMC [Legionella massiliensis]CEE13059.1 hypothetical protein BN1094_01604 [Legionella massiliensis]